MLTTYRIIKRVHVKAFKRILKFYNCTPKSGFKLSGAYKNMVRIEKASAF